uniref:Senataxin n=1 Tax=Sphenodon punctatus TaxID=8508 RepID=A0A8D0LAZ5_SPHPU
MSPCLWCTLGGPTATKSLEIYASKRMPPEELSAASDDLCYCLDCVVEYHNLRDEVPSLHEVFWELETSRLISHFEKSMKRQIEEDVLFIVDENGETPLYDDTGLDFEKNLRVPLLEILKYPYLLLHERVSVLFVEALCKMEEDNYSFHVSERHPGIYLLMVHPNEKIRRWAIMSARNLGKVERDDYYDLQEVLTCLFKVIEVGLFDSPDIYSSSVIEKGKLILLPSHLYDTTNYKNYWLGVCMLLTVLEEQAMDSLLLGPDKQNDFMQSILNAMDKQTDDGSNNPFWPALHCFMVILDRLGSKVWGQLIDPIQAFQTIINNVSYKNEIQSIRNSSKRTKTEPVSDYGDEMVSCSQIVYNFNTEKPPKDSGWKSAICPDYCPNMYEDMQTLAHVLQSDIGQDMRVHNSTFLWFIPFVQSLMGLKDLGVAYIVEVIHHLCSEVKEIINERVQQCDAVSEFFILILVSVIELHRNKKCLHLLWVSSQEWVEAVVKCAKLPAIAFTRCTGRTLANCPRATSISSQSANSVQHACVQLIRSLLKEGYQRVQPTLCKQFLDQLNLLLRGNFSLGWQLSSRETQDLQMCLRQVLRNINKSSNTSPSVENSAACPVLPAISIKQEKEAAADEYPLNVHHRNSLSPPLPLACKTTEVCQGSALLRKTGSWEVEQRETPFKNSNFHVKEESLLTNVKKEPDDMPPQECKHLNVSPTTKLHTDSQKNRNHHQGQEQQNTTLAKHSFGTSHLDIDFQNSSMLEGRSEIRSRIPECRTVFCSSTPENFPSLNEGNGSGGSNSKVETGNSKDLKKPSWAPKLLHLIKTSANVKKSRMVKGDLDESVGQNQSSKDANQGMCENKTSVDSNLPSWPANKGGKSMHNASQIIPLSIKLESKDRLLTSFPKNETNLEESISDEALDDVPLSVIRCDLLKKRSSQSTVADNLTDSQVDRDLDSLSLTAYAKGINFPVDSSQESTAPNLRDIKRKVKGAVNNIIIISDSSSDDDDDDEKDANMKNIKKEKIDDKCPQKQPNYVSANVKKEEKSKTSSSPMLYEECDSQCFEFETENEIYSVWQDSPMHDELDQAHEQDSCLKPETCYSSKNEELEDQTNYWGYETDYIGEDVIEKAAEAVEQQINPLSHLNKKYFTEAHAPTKDKVSVEPNRSTSSVPLASKLSIRKQALSPRENSVTSEDRDLIGQSPSTSSKLYSKKYAQSPGKSQLKSKLVRTAHRSPKKGSLKPTAQTKKLPQMEPSRSIPAVIPPKKVRQRPEPSSTVEKLGLKKAPRKAFELSQRSLDSVTELRSHGKAAGVVSIPQKQKAKLISPQNLAVKNNRKMLACQDLQFWRQTRPKPGGSSESRSKIIPKKTDPKYLQQPPATELPSADGLGENQTEKLAEWISYPLSIEGKQLRKSFVSEREVQSTHVSKINSKFPLTSPGSTDVDVEMQESTLPVFSPSPCDVGTALKESKSKLYEKSDDEDNLFLTQLDPVDMEMCSQMENFSDVEVSNDTDPGMSSSHLETEPLNIVTCKNKDCPERVGKAGEYCSKHSDPDASDHLFAKPTLPSLKSAKPSTTKIFISNGASRNASLTKELENGPKLPVACKSKTNMVKPAASNPANPVFKTPTFSSRLRPQSSSNVLRPQNMQNDSISSFPKGLVAGTHVGKEVCPSVSQVSVLITQHRDHSIFVKEVLKWNYHMFANFSQARPPDNLLQSIVASVPVKFQGYNDYFNTFFPLMMLNAFETVTCIWESDLAKQLHPKEDDLIFLAVPEKCNTYTEESETETRLVYHVGLVTRFSRTSRHEMRQNERHIVCHFSIQTRANLSFYINQPVKCIVASSLITTQRRFKGLLLLSRSPLVKPIIYPSYPDFCPRNLNVASESVASYMKEFNEDQQKAIETAYAMVKQHSSLPRICLINGPPGTGKSKTIVGLLFRILAEVGRSQNLNAKIKRNRVLVCAPSNAAVDELMKKIILEFKDKCQDKAKAFGNCGDINLVRLGPEKSISSDVLRFSLDSQVSHKMKRGALDQDIHKQKEALDHQLDKLSRQRAMDRLSVLPFCSKVRGRPQEMQASIILESHIICCTLSTSGGFLLESAFRRQGLDPFSCVIVDEAGQSCEVETLIPLIHRCSKLVLVGDSKQLPPTVISMKAQDYGYDQSLMARLHKHLEELVQQNAIGKLPVVQLTVQYRMHPDICLFPSNYIYGRTLKTNRETEEKRCSTDWPFQPYLVFDVGDGQERRDNDSFANPQEVKLVMEIMKLIKEKKKDIAFRNIGIITPYSAQKRRIQQELDREIGEVDTVDGFQGRQKDCIIVTCVRANSAQGSIGFLASLQRLNVTITRARFSLFILGRLGTLMENKDWEQLIQDAQRRGAIIKTCDHNYKKDAVKILKLKPTSQRPPLSHPSVVLPEMTRPRQSGSPSDRQSEAAPRKESDLRKFPASGTPSARGSGGLHPPPASHGSFSKEATFSTQAKAAAQPAVRERLQDPRLARRAEPAAKEQASRNNSLSAPSHLGKTLPQGPEVPSARRGHSNSEHHSAVSKASQALQQPDTSHAARRDRDWRVSYATKGTAPRDTERPKSQSEWRKDQDYRPGSRRTSEQTPERDSNDAKRRRISY